MSNKSAQIYQAVFEFIEQYVFEMKPAEFMTDFELGMRKAINTCYPNAILRGCWFHFKAALRRRFMNLHMYRVITDDLNARKIYRMLSNLPLLPLQSIEKGYQMIKEEAQSKKLLKVFKKIFIYFERYWLNLVVSCYCLCSYGFVFFINVKFS